MRGMSSSISDEGWAIYSIHAAKEVSEWDLVYATDLKKELFDTILEWAKDPGLNNIWTVAGNICDPFSLGNTTIDVCLLSTVLHCLDRDSGYAPLLREIRRVMKPGGRLCIIEYKKEKMLFGPPLSMRVSAEDLEAFVPSYGFRKDRRADFGYNYLIRFVPAE